MAAIDLDIKHIAEFGSVHDSKKRPLSKRDEERSSEDEGYSEVFSIKKTGLLTCPKMYFESHQRRCLPPNHEISSDILTRALDEALGSNQTFQSHRLANTVQCSLPCSLLLGCSLPAHPRFATHVLPVLIAYCSFVHADVLPYRTLVTVSTTVLVVKINHVFLGGERKS